MQWHQRQRRQHQQQWLKMSFCGFQLQVDDISCCDRRQSTSQESLSVCLSGTMCPLSSDGSENTTLWTVSIRRLNSISISRTFYFVNNATTPHIHTPTHTQWHESCSPHWIQLDLIFGKFHSWLIVFCNAVKSVHLTCHRNGWQSVVVVVHVCGYIEKEGDVPHLILSCRAT